MYILNNVHIIYIILSIHISMCVSFTYHKKLHGPVTCVLQIYYILPCYLLTIPLYRKTYLILALVILYIYSISNIFDIGIGNISTYSVHEFIYIY